MKHQAQHPSDSDLARYVALEEAGDNSAAEACLLSLFRRLPLYAPSAEFGSRLLARVRAERRFGAAWNSHWGVRAAAALVLAQLGVLFWRLQAVSGSPSDLESWVAMVGRVVGVTADSLVAVAEVSQVLWQIALVTREISLEWLLPVLPMFVGASVASLAVAIAVLARLLSAKGEAYGLGS